MPRHHQGREIADFRSDTVTEPDEAMRAAMARAAVGDDVFDEDPTVHELQALGAATFGFEAALFVPSGTMSNLIATMLHARAGDEAIFEQRAHMYNCEGAGGVWIAGVQPRPIVAPGGVFKLADLQAAIRADDPHYPRSALLCVENTHNFYGGRVIPIEHLMELRAFCVEKKLKLHIDGARIMNAVVATGISPSAFGGLADSLSCCLSKGLGAPVGSLLLGSRADITRARRLRKALGGGMRQVGVLAAAGLLALREGPRQLARDHENAKTLAIGLAAIPGLLIQPELCETNILFVRCEAGAEAEQKLVAQLREQDIWAIAMAGLGIRFVTHRHIEDRDLERCLAALRKALA